MKYLFLLSIITIFAFLSGCGNKEVGHGSSDDIYYGYTPEHNSNMYEHARYPISGNKIQQRLYMLNKPEVQAQINSIHRSYFERGSTATPKKSNPNEPKYRSPFIEY